MKTVEASDDDEDGDDEEAQGRKAAGEKDAAKGVGVGCFDCGEARCK